MAILNTASSIVDYLKSQNKPSDFTSRKSLYDTSGLTGAFGDYRGTAEQNVSLLRRISAPTAGRAAPAGGITEPPPTAKDVIDATAPSTISSAFDLEKSDAEKRAEEEKKGLTLDLGAETARGAETLQRGVTTLKRTAEEGIFDLGEVGKESQQKIGEKAAGFGGAFSGTTKKSQAEIAQEVVMKQERVRAKLGDQLYDTFSDFEKQFGTKFLESLSIPEAQQFVKLPVAVRGIVMQNYQEAVSKAEEKAKKGAVDALDKLGYVVIGGQIIQKPSETRAGEADIRAERRLELAEEAGRRAEESIGKLTESEKKQAQIPVIESTLLRTKGVDGFVNPQTYLSERMKSPFSGSDFDARFSHSLSPAERAALKDKDPLGFDSI